MSRRRTPRALWVPARTTSLLLLAGCTSVTSQPSAPSPAPSLVAPPRAEEDAGGDALGIVARPSSTELTDARGDVWLVRRRDRAPRRLDRPGLDLTRTSVRHGTATVRVRAVLAAARPGPGVLDLGVGTAAGRWFADVPLAGGALQRFVSPDGDRVRCPRATSVRRDRVLTVSVPRECLADPAWVTVRVLLSAPAPGGTLYENAHNDRPFAEAGTGRLYRAAPAD